MSRVWEEYAGLKRDGTAEHVSQNQNLFISVANRDRNNTSNITYTHTPLPHTTTAAAAADSIPEYPTFTPIF